MVGGCDDGSLCQEGPSLPRSSPPLSSPLLFATLRSTARRTLADASPAVAAVAAVARLGTEAWNLFSFPVFSLPPDRWASGVCKHGAPLALAVGYLWLAWPTPVTDTLGACWLMVGRSERGADDGDGVRGVTVDGVPLRYDRNGGGPGGKTDQLLVRRNFPTAQRMFVTVLLSR